MTAHAPETQALVEAKANANSRVPPKAVRGGILRRFGKDTRGVVAIEFAILAMPFFLLMFAILETCLSFAAQQVMADSVDDLAREIRVGTIRTADATPAAIRDRICNDLEIFVDNNCPDLFIDLQPYATYDAMPTTIPRKADNDINPAGFKILVGPALTAHSLRVFYRWPFYTDLIAKKLADLPNSKTLMFAAAAWRNEPYSE